MTVMLGFSVRLPTRLFTAAPTTSEFADVRQSRGRPNNQDRTSILVRGGRPNNRIVARPAVSAPDRTTSRLVDQAG
jgi:hypothetical protein